MNINTPYRTITREQFLFNEMRIVASLLSEGKSEKEIIEEISNRENDKEYCSSMFEQI